LRSASKLSRAAETWTSGSSSTGDFVTTKTWRSASCDRTALNPPGEAPISAIGLSYPFP
jgi:hypothetical protein